MKAKFENFLKQLKTDENTPLIETIEKGFNAIQEGYADVREEKVDTLATFNQQASMLALSMGNPVLNFLQNSAESYDHLYTEEEPSELDFNPTSTFYQDQKVEKDEIEDSLGLTASDTFKSQF